VEGAESAKGFNCKSESSEMPLPDEAEKDSLSVGKKQNIVKPSANRFGSYGEETAITTFGLDSLLTTSACLYVLLYSLG
jgi:hypothetical protein